MLRAARVPRRASNRRASPLITWTFYLTHTFAANLQADEDMGLDNSKHGGAAYKHDDDNSKHGGNVVKVTTASA